MYRSSLHVLRMVLESSELLVEVMSVFFLLSRGACFCHCWWAAAEVRTASVFAAVLCVSSAAVFWVVCA